MATYYKHMYVTLVDTSFNLISYLISEFSHLKLGGSRCLVLSMGPPVMEEGRRRRRGEEEQQASSLVAKQAVEISTGTG